MAIAPYGKDPANWVRSSFNNQEEIQSNLKHLSERLRPCLADDLTTDESGDDKNNNFVFEPCLYLHNEEFAGPTDVVSYTFINDFPCSEGTFDGYENIFVQGWNTKYKSKLSQ